jgi:hypothetical protein
MGNLKIEIDMAEASAVVAASRVSARNLIDWCDRLDKLIDDTRKVLDERDTIGSSTSR